MRLGGESNRIGHNSRLTLLFLSRIFGFPLPFLFVTFLGVSTDMNPFYVLFSAAAALSGICSSIIEVHTIKICEGRFEINNYNSITSVFLFGSLFSIIFLTFAWIGYRNSNYLLTILCMSFVPIGNGIQGYINAISLVRKKYFTAIALNLIRVIVIIFTIIMFRSIFAISIGILMAEIIRILFILCVFFHQRFSQSQNFALLSSSLKQTISSLFSSLNPVGDRFIVERFELGSVGILDIAEKSISTLSLIFSLGILPTISPKLIATDAYEYYLIVFRRISRVYISVSLILILAGFGTIHFIHFDNPNIHQFILLASLYSICLLFVTSNQLSVRFLILHGGIKNVTTSSLLILLLNISFDLILLTQIGVYAIPIASLFAYAAGAFLNFKSVKRLASKK